MSPDPVAPHAEPPPAVPSESGARSYGFPRANRVTRGPEIEHVRQEGKRVRTASMDVRAFASLSVSAIASLDVSASGTNASGMKANNTKANGARGRVGIIVPKYGHSSVDRNKVKRRLRELVRIEVLPVLPTIDVVLRAAPKAYARTFDELREEVRKWSQQLITGRVAR